MSIAQAAGANDTAPAERPNILWITCEDISPNLGCYGDAFARTPNLDAFAKQSVLFTRAFSTAGVCAPSRSCLITGMYPPSIGTHHMRCQGQLPEGVQCFPRYLRQAGYYCSNNSKTDYNFDAPRETWDANGGAAHWRNRKPDQPFFAVFNFNSSHESQVRSQQTNRNLDEVTLPPYHPDTPVVRRNWARYADAITTMDGQAGNLLKQLEADGLAEETIVFFFSDHGAGLPRGKRWLYDSSTRVPMMVRFPAKYAHLANGEAGTQTDRLVSFVDFAPTVLSLAGIDIPEHMQGHAFLGEQAAEPREYVYGHRDRMDERYDIIRSVRNGRFKYIRNFRPDLPWFQHQHIDYMYEMPIMQVWQRMADEGKLEGPAAAFMAMKKPREELYDTEADPWEVNNLADDPKYYNQLVGLREELLRWMGEIRDLGLLPESDLRSRFGDQAPYDAVRENPDSNPVDLFAVGSELIDRGFDADVVIMLDLTTLHDPAARYWGCVGLGTVKAEGERKERIVDRLKMRLNDERQFVRAAAAEALTRRGGHDELAVAALAELMQSTDEWDRLYAANALDRLSERALPAAEAMKKGRKDGNQYVARVCEHFCRRMEIK